LKRDSFSLLVAIVFILMLGIIMALSIALSSQSLEQTAKTYLTEQSQLLAKSATEYAILAAQGHDFSTSCLNSINLSFKSLYDVNITIHYLGNNLPPGCNLLNNSISTKESNLTMVIDTKVYIKEGTNEGVSFFRRTLQKL